MTIRPSNPLHALGLRGVRGTPAPGLDQRTARNNTGDIGTALRFNSAFDGDDYGTVDVGGTSLDVTRIRPTQVALTGDWLLDPNAVIRQALEALGAVQILDLEAVAGL